MVLAGFHRLCLIFFGSMHAHPLRKPICFVHTKTTFPKITELIIKTVRYLDVSKELEKLLIVKGYTQRKRGHYRKASLAKLQ